MIDILTKKVNHNDDYEINLILKVYLSFVITEKAKIVLTFTFTKNYPDELPEISIEETENIRDENDVMEFLKKLVSFIQ